MSREYDVLFRWRGNLTLVRAHGGTKHSAEKRARRKLVDEIGRDDAVRAAIASITFIPVNARHGGEE